MGPPTTKEQSKNTAAANRIATTAHRPPTKLPASRSPSQEMARSTSAPSRRYEEPWSASEPPEGPVRRDIHPTTLTTRSTSAGARPKTDGSQHAATSKAAGFSKQFLQEISSETRTSEASAQAPLSQKDTEKIECLTRGQRDNPDWYYWRQNRITASVAHQISNSKFANRKTSDIPQSYLKSVLGTGPKVQTAAMSWGIRNEKCAVRNYEKQALKNKGREVKVEDCGLFIHPTKSWLAASPDGIVKDKITGETLCILEVKCPYKHKDHTIREACADRNFCLALDEDSYVLKTNHAYYTQVQCQLASTGMRNADFVVHTNKETVVVPLKFNPEFWKEKEPKLEIFYKEAVVPQIKKQYATDTEEQKYNIHAPEE